MKIKYICMFIVAVAIMSFQSCENEPLDPDFIENSNNTNEDEETDDGTTESSGDYWPMAIGNIWNYSNTILGDTACNIVSTEIIDDNLYYKCNQFGNQESWLRKAEDSYYQRSMIQSMPIEGYEVTSTYITIKMLKDTAQIGETWSSNVSYDLTYVATTEGLPEIPSINMNAVYDLEMKGRDLTRTVGDTTYENVLHVELNLSMSPNIVSATTDYYYAKGIGPIEIIGDDSSSILLSYTLN